MSATTDPLYRQLFALTYEDARPAKARLADVVSAIHKARPRHQWTGVYLLLGDVLELGAYVGAATEHVRIPSGRGLCGKAVMERRDLDVPDVHLEPAYLACSIGTKSEAIALIWHCGEIVGQIDVDSDASGEFGLEAMQGLRLAADLIAPLCAQLV